jgi:transcription-repair coupling factor (superfamily II helicase)
MIFSKFDSSLNTKNLSTLFFILNSIEKKKTIVVFPTRKEAETLLKCFPGYQFFPNYDILPFEGVKPSQTDIRDRFKSLNALSKNNFKIVTTATALHLPVVPPHIFNKTKFTISINQSLEYMQLSKKLIDLGYKRVDFVEEYGEFSMRGDIIDIFATEPIRIELEFDKIVRIDKFNPVTQRSVEKLEKFIINQAYELLPKEIEKLKEIFSSYNEPLLPEIKLHLWSYQTLVHEKSSLHSYTNKETLYIIINPEKTIKEIKNLEERTMDIFNYKIFKELTHKVFFEFNINNFKNRFLIEEKDGIDLSYKTSGKIENIAIALKEKGYSIYLPSHIKIDGFENYNGSYPESIKYEDKIYLSDKKNKKITTSTSTFSEMSSPIDDIESLNPGDIIVHKEFGIGKFVEITTITTFGSTIESLVIEYRDNSKIYVPVERLDRVQKYIGNKDIVKLSSLKGKEWQKQKSKIREKIREKIEELVSIYALREIKNGFEFKVNNERQKKFESGFKYLETPDQLKSISEVMKDMQSPKIMDRLIVGDVGYGKTEVALRAAFLAMDSGKQVAMVAPTTILAKQHYELIKERIEDFEFNVELLTRMVPKSKQKEIIEGLSYGKTDMVIGTHRLFQDDIKFLDLGLVIIDEEQKFGVLQKEKFKKLRTSVDVISMSATPIPRSLNMALSGIRNISIINSPPPGRLKVYTFISKYSDEILKSAILRELERGGQIFIVNDRIRGLKEIYIKVKSLVENAQVSMVHGRMNKKIFESSIDDFYEGKTDILVSTSIIENGIDLPNANTLIVMNSQNFGLAQLYQLKGRVGRSTRRAFAYFLYPSRGIKEDAKKRLEALKELARNEGGGLKLAMKDMEIRGVGNVLGVEQSGFINSAGLNTYYEILNNEIKRFKGERIQEEEYIDTEFRGFDLDIFIPKNYIENNFERIKIYRRFSLAKNLKEIDKLTEELKDRFGNFDEKVEKFIKLIRARLILFKLGAKVVKFDRKNRVCAFEFKSRKETGDFNLPLRSIKNLEKNMVIVYNIQSFNKLCKILEGVVVSEKLV